MIFYFFFTLYIVLLSLDRVVVGLFKKRKELADGKVYIWQL